MQRHGFRNSRVSTAFVNNKEHKSHSKTRLMYYSQIHAARTKSRKPQVKPSRFCVTWVRSWKHQKVQQWVSLVTGRGFRERVPLPSVLLTFPPALEYEAWLPAGGPGTVWSSLASTLLHGPSIAEHSLSRSRFYHFPSPKKPSIQAHIFSFFFFWFLHYLPFKFLSV